MRGPAGARIVLGRSRGDDAPYVLDVVTEILEQRGATVTAVGSAEEALAPLQSERPGVVVTDKGNT
jgi:CheY-like chemotaxis protein